MIILLGFGELSGTWTNPQWMAHSLQNNGYNVLYLNPPYYKNFGSINAKEVLKRFKSRLHGQNSNRRIAFSHKSIYLLSPFRNLFIGAFLFRLFYPKTLKLIRNSTVICFHPLWLVFLRANNVDLYFLADDYRTIGKQDLLLNKLWTYLEESKFPICVTSTELINDYQKKENIYHFPNVIPIELLREVPEKVPNQVVFVGTLSQMKIDLKWLINLVRKNPNYNFLIIGRNVDLNLSELIEHSNVEWLGPMDYEKAQDIVRQSPIALMPFLLNKYTIGMHPMKYFEYLAAHCNVVSTNIRFFQDESYSHLPKTLSIGGNIRLLSLLHSDVDVDLKEYTYKSRIKEMKKKRLI